MKDAALVLLVDSFVPPTEKAGRDGWRGSNPTFKVPTQVGKYGIALSTRRTIKPLSPRCIQRPRRFDATRTRGFTGFSPSKSESIKTPPECDICIRATLMRLRGSEYSKPRGPDAAVDCKMHLPAATACGDGLQEQTGPGLSRGLMERVYGYPKREQFGHLEFLAASCNPCVAVEASVF